jgi:hypothetical protein
VEGPQLLVANAPGKLVGKSVQASAVKPENTLAGTGEVGQELVYLIRDAIGVVLAADIEIEVGALRTGMAAGLIEGMRNLGLRVETSVADAARTLDRVPHLRNIPCVLKGPDGAIVVTLYLSGPPVL